MARHRDRRDIGLQVFAALSEPPGLRLSGRDFEARAGARLIRQGAASPKTLPIRGTKVFATPRISAAPKMVSLALTTFGTSGSGLHLPFLSSAKLATLLLCMA